MNPPSGRSVTTGQIVMLGLTGGLVPCPAAITVLVLCFSAGLAVTMVSAGVIASPSVKHIQSRWPGFGALARRAPYASGALMLVIAPCMCVSGWMALQG